MLSLFTAIALAGITLEVPVERARDASRTVRRLADLGHSASVVRAPEGTRVRLDVAPSDPESAQVIADAISQALGLGVLLIKAEGAPPSTASAPQVAPVGEGLLDRLDTATSVQLTYTRQVHGQSVHHDWLRVGDRISLTITADPPLQSSRLLLGPDVEVLWTADGQVPASRSQLQSWVEQLGPTAIFGSALRVGFGGTTPPDEGCRVRLRETLCVVLSAKDVPRIEGTAIVFRGARTTPDGRWIPIEISRYAGEDLEDRLVDLAIGYPGNSDKSRFEADKAGMRIEP